MKTGIKITAVILAVLLLLIGLVYLTRTLLRYGAYGAEETDVTTSEGTVEYYENEGGIPYLIKRLPSGEIADDFKIFSTSDMHVNEKTVDFTVEIFRRFIDKEKPDLVVLCGDNVLPDKENVALYRQLTDVFEEKQVYWTFVLGNHDGEEYNELGEEESRRKAYELLSDSPHCLARDEGGEEVFGYGNHVINVKNADGVMQTLFFIDGGRNMLDKYCAEEGVENDHGYDFIKQDQMRWYSRRLEEVTAENGGVLPKSMVFCHIAMAEYKTAWHDVLTMKKDVKRLYGDVWEQFGCSSHSSGFVDLMREKGSTHTVVVGHDHVNGFAIDYKGIRLTYTMCTSYGSYNRRHRCSGEKFLAFWNSIDKKASFTIDGVTDYRINKDGSVDIMPKYAQYEGIYDGLEDQLREICGGNETYNH